MNKVIRKGIAFDATQLKAFDTLSKKRGYANRSEAMRDLIRESLILEATQESSSIMMATLTIVYDHHEHQVQHELMHIEHDAGHMIRSVLHVHIDHDNCLEVLVMQGRVDAIKDIANRIIATRGVQHGKLVLTTQQIC